jgi:hypothetical protein
MDILPDPARLDIASHSTIQQSRIDNVSILSVQMAACQLFDRQVSELAYGAVPL